MNLLFGATLLLSAALLMMVQPLAGRLVLPVTGGAAGTWTTCMLFFQVGLLLGYGWAHLASRHLPTALGVVFHLIVVLGAYLLQPIAIPAPEQPPAMPVAWLLAALFSGVALPY